MYQFGAWDFAGGLVVHEAAGFSSLVAVKFLGRRKFPRKAPMPEAHSMPIMMMGLAMMWFGWFGFNTGAAMTIGGLPGAAFVNTQIAPCAACCVWIFLDIYVKGKASLRGACMGVITGLVVVTPGAGFMQAHMALICGILGTLAAYTSIELIDLYTNLDDTLDTFSVHGVAGFLGMCLVGIVADPAPECAVYNKGPTWCANPGTVTRSLPQFLIQTWAAIVAAVYSMFVTFVLLRAIYCFFPKLKDYESQELARDPEQYGENAYAIQEEDELDSEGTSTHESYKEQRRSYHEQSNHEVPLKSSLKNALSS